jgi:HD-like signal output (HDOD) protein
VAEPPPPAEPEPDPALEEQAALVLGHFRENRPGPASAPSMSLRILNLVASPDGDIGELSRLVSADPALTAGVLTVANSALYRGVREIETVREALARLGFDEVARIAGALSAKSLFNPRLKAELAAFGPRFGALYHRALTVASGAAWQAMQRRGGRSDRAFLGGMLHDVGKSVALRSVAALSLEGKLALPAGEAPLARLLDQVHLEVGGECHQEWDMPQYLTVIAVRHHDEAVPGGDEFADLHAVRLTAAVHDLRAEPEAAARAAAEVVQSAGALGLTPNAVRALAAELRDVTQRVAAAFSLEHRPRG